MSKLIDGGLLETMCLRVLSETDYTTAYQVEQVIKKRADLLLSNRAVRMAINRLCKIGLVSIKESSLKRRVKLFGITNDGWDRLVADSRRLQKISTFIIKKSAEAQ